MAPKEMTAGWTGFCLEVSPALGRAPSEGKKEETGSPSLILTSPSGGRSSRDLEIPYSAQHHPARLSREKEQELMGNAQGRGKTIM